MPSRPEVTGKRGSGSPMKEPFSQELSPLVRIVDDEETVRNSEKFIFRIIGLESETYGSAEEFIDKVDETRPGCIVADLRMKEINGLEMMTILRSRGIKLPIVFLTGHGTVDSAVLALKNGAYDFLQKPVQPERLQEIVLKMIEIDKERRAKEKAVEEKQRLLATLTERERQVLERVALDQMNKVIACDLSIAEHTVKIHRANALRKLGVRTAMEAANFLKEARSNE